jgi:twitching motility protein PilT
MAQLDQIIKVMLGQPNSELSLATGIEPQLRIEGAPPHTLIQRKLTAPHLRVLLGELASDAPGTIPALEQADSGEFTYTPAGHAAVSVSVRSWSGNVEARIRPASVRRPQTITGAAVARIELAKAPATELRRAATNPATEARARAGEPAVRAGASDSYELDLAPRAPAASQTEDSLELDLAQPPPQPPQPISRHDMQSVSAPEPPSQRQAEPRPEPKPEPKAEKAAAPIGTADAINVFFRKMIKLGASDLHLCSGERPMIRKDGDMMRFEDAQRLKHEQVFELLRPIIPERNWEEFERDHDTDFAYDLPSIGRFRANIFLDRKGIGAVFRTIPSEIMTADKLGLSPAIQNLCFLSKGLVLVTGPTGSGKSTTLSALIDLVNRTRHDHVVTIEDPIEFIHPSKSCLVNQRQVGEHTESFKRALRAALREDPDVVMVGELRDLETIGIAIETAETGHLVFGTLHTSTAYSTVDRLIDSFPPDRQAQIRVMLSESLKGVISQTLCKRIGGGRIPALEVLLINGAVQNMIREGKTFQIPSIMQTGRKQGMVLLNDALLELVQAKKVEAKEAYVKAIDKANFVNALKAAGHKLDFLAAAVGGDVPPPATPGAKPA